MSPSANHGIQFESGNSMMPTHDAPPPQKGINSVNLNQYCQGGLAADLCATPVNHTADHLPIHWPLQLSKVQQHVKTLAPEPDIALQRTSFAHVQLATQHDLANWRCSMGTQSHLRSRTTTVTLSRVPFLKAAMTRALETSFAIASLTWPLLAISSLSVSCTCALATSVPTNTPSTRSNYHGASAAICHSLG